MNPFWTREARLARRLKAERPEPSRKFLGSMLERLDAAEPVAQRRSFGLRVGLASAVSLAFLTSLAAFGGLGHAATSLAHVGRTATHVVIPQHRAHPAPVQESTASASTSQATSSSQATSAAADTAQSSSGNASSAETNVSSGAISSADDQYNNQFVCVLFSPNKYHHIIQLPRFLVPFFLQIHPTAVVVPCPSPRHGRGG